MKLQIISRLTKRESCPLDLGKSSLRTTNFLNTESTQITDKINQYYSINTQTNATNNKQAKENNHLRDFFNQFSTKCQIQYNTVDTLPNQVKRKLKPALQSIKNKRPFIKLQATQSTSKQQANIGQCWGIHPKPIPLQLDPKQTYYYQRVQKIRKVSSLISLDNNPPSGNSIDSTRKPGFIRLNKSVAKKQSSLSKLILLQPNRQQVEIPIKMGSTTSNSRSGSKMQNEINDSKQRIAKIRRQLNEIYNMRNRPMQYRLKLK